MKLKYSELSRVISHALRHQPEVYNLHLDNEGWVSLESLLAALRLLKKEWKELSKEDLETMIAKSEKKRHEIINGKIRAAYGHTLSSKVTMTPVSPPEILYHGTAPESAAIILSEGLKPMERQYVHLALNKDDAKQVGKRKSPHPVILKVFALKAFAAGISFYEGNDRVLLSEPISARYIERQNNE